MREMRDRASTLFITVGPSPLGTPVNGSDSGCRYVSLLDGPKVETEAMRKYRQAFHPRPAPTTRVGKALHKLGRMLSSAL